jgi:hypothetical protein
MKIKLKNAATGKFIDAEIREAKQSELPSIHAGWRFNFDKHVKLPNAKAYVITTRETPDVIEGCLIFQMKERTIPYMAFVEKAPHNKGEKTKFKFVAECLIAYACRLSHTKGEGDNKGWLTFDVKEERNEDTLKLMSLYSQRYYAVRVDDTTMYIQPAHGQSLIDEYLRDSDNK